MPDYIPSPREWVRDQVELYERSVVQPMRVREVADAAERARLWDLAVSAYPPYAEYQMRTTRQIPIFVAEPDTTRKASG
jgi:F420H(2)-dependent quinone reductase